MPLEYLHKGELKVNFLLKKSMHLLLLSLFLKTCKLRFFNDK